MTLGYCLHHRRELDPDEMRSKNCRKKNKSGKKCKHLMLLSTKDRYYNSNKGVRR